MFLYHLLGLLVSLLLAPLFLLTARGRRHFGHRLGGWHLKTGRYLWLHGASAGEVTGLLPLVHRLRREFPELKLLLTATSTTGLDQGAQFVDETRLLPFDHPLWIERALGGVRLAGVVIAETEIWPALLQVLRDRDVPVWFVNCRISDHTVAHYRWFRPLLGPLLNTGRSFLVSNEIAATRFEALGVLPRKLQVVGNMKYDRLPSFAAQSEREQYRAGFLFRPSLPVVVLGSLRPGEEEFWFPPLAECQEKIDIIVAPRHKEKVEYFEAALRKAGIEYTLRSRSGAATGCVVLDTFGELERCYALADLAFIGATLVPIGGHNPLEAAAYGVPVVVGPYTSNISDVTDSLRSAGGVFEVRSSADVRALLTTLVLRPDELRQVGRKGAAVWEHEYRGATERVFSFLRCELRTLEGTV